MLIPHRTSSWKAAACVLGALALATALYVAPAATAHQATFSGQLCSLVKSGVLDAADITEPCAQLPTNKGNTGTFWTANWGKQVVVGGADHFLGVTVTKYSSQLFPRIWAASGRPMQNTTQISTGKLREHYSVLEYNSVSGPPKKGAQGVLTAVTRNGYGVSVALFDRPTTQSDVKAGLLLVAGQVLKTLLASA